MKLKCFALLLALSLLTGCHKAPQEAAIPTDAPHPTQESQEYPEAPPAQSFQEPEIQISLETVSQQGRYRVIFTDALEQNSFTLFYEDGILISLETAFRGSSDAAPMVSYASGAILEDFHYKAIHFLSCTPQALAECLAQEGFTHVSVTSIE